MDCMFLSFELGNTFCLLGGFEIENADGVGKSDLVEWDNDGLISVWFVVKFRGENKGFMKNVFQSVWQKHAWTSGWGIACGCKDQGSNPLRV